tara:strand:- start:435 stop:887 length:453 start_codon:yes stop_codon:yes gene_type:complete
MSNTLSSKKRFELITGTLSWLNETFTKFGMKPIEDLPEAWVCDSYQCVLARALTASLEDKFEAVSVGYGSITMRPVGTERPTYGDSHEDPTQYFDVPDSVREFIQGFDAGQFPEFIAEDSPQNPDTGNSIVEVELDATYNIVDDEGDLKI